MQRDPEELSLLCELLILGIEALDRLHLPGGSEGPAGPVYKGMQAAHDLLRSGDDPDTWLAAVDARHELRQMVGAHGSAEPAQAEAQPSSGSEALPQAGPEPVMSSNDAGQGSVMSAVDIDAAGAAGPDVSADPQVRIVQLRSIGEQLNALASRMVGLDHGETEVFSQIRDQLSGMRTGQDLEPGLASSLGEVGEPFERLSSGSSEDPQADFDQAVDRLDAVSDHLREALIAAETAFESGGAAGNSQPAAAPPQTPVSSPAPVQPQAPAAPPASVQPQASASSPEPVRSQAPAPASSDGKTPGRTGLDTGPDEQSLPPDFDRELMGEFVTECRDLIEAAEGALLELESDPDNMEAVNTVFRAFHTIKGTSGFLGVTLMGNLAHKAENLLTRVRDKEIRCTGGYADLSLRSCDMLKALVENVQEALGGAPLYKPQGYDDLLEVLADPEGAGVSGDPGEGECLDLRVGDLLVGSQKADRQAVESTVVTLPGEKIGQALVRSKVATAGDVSRALRTQKKIAGKGDSAMDASVRVRTERLDRLIDMVGELVIAQSMVAQDNIVLGDTRQDLQRKVTHTGKIVRELQDLTMSMRMVPLKPTFQKMTRLVRDLAHKSGKQVEFVTSGEDTEIDRNMVDVIGDPLVHMIRNAADHGIESPEARTAAGKPPTGRVVLSAYHAGGNVVVELKDDGKGLDREKIARKAMERGLIESDKGMSDSEVYNLIFEAGFSTADQVTEVSGRGVGMDVVRRAIQSLRGRVEISSEKGRGTTFTVKLPLTLAITDGMLIRVGSQRFIIPTVSIHMSFRPEQSAVSTITGRGEMVMLRGNLVPIIRLHRLFHLDGAIETPTDALLVVIDDGDRRSALLVDELLGQQQVVAKSLGEGMGKVAGVSGGAILGDGRVGLILDPGGISTLARGGLSTADQAALMEMMAA